MHAKLLQHCIRPGKHREEGIFSCENAQQQQRQVSDWTLLFNRVCVCMSYFNVSIAPEYAAIRLHETE